MTRGQQKRLERQGREGRKREEERKWGCSEGGIQEEDRKDKESVLEMERQNGDEGTHKERILSSSALYVCRLERGQILRSHMGMTEGF